MEVGLGSPPPSGASGGRTGPCAPGETSPGRCQTAWVPGSLLASEASLPQVEPSRYYKACVSDACACNSGGDCECFCTAVAAYAQACHDVGVCVSWRTPDVCRECSETCLPGRCGGAGGHESGAERRRGGRESAEFPSCPRAWAQGAGVPKKLATCPPLPTGLLGPHPPRLHLGAQRRDMSSEQGSGCAVAPGCPSRGSPPPWAPRAERPALSRPLTHSSALRLLQHPGPVRMALPLLRGALSEDLPEP